MFSEQFVQDVLCRPERINRVLEQLGYTGWQFFPLPEKREPADCDVVNQEISVGKGRIDTLATFNRRSRLVVVEVKAGTAGLEAVEQLDWYLKNLPFDSLGLQNVQQVVGIVLAEAFVGIPEVPPNVSLIEFKFNGNAWPFHQIRPQDTLPKEVEEEVVSRAAKGSRLVTLADHRDWIKDLDLRNAFNSITQCFVDPNDPRSEWVLANAKGGHIAIHYKGEYLVHLWAKRNCFYVGYQVEGRSEWIKVEAANRVESLQRVERDCQKLLAHVDTQLASAIPPEFRWRTAT